MYLHKHTSLLVAYAYVDTHVHAHIRVFGPLHAHEHPYAHKDLHVTRHIHVHACEYTYMRVFMIL